MHSVRKRSCASMRQILQWRVTYRIGVDTTQKLPRIVLLVGNGSYILEKVLNFTCGLEKFLNLVKGLEKYLISLY